jgi:uncharacterized membrane protein YqjE
MSAEKGGAAAKASATSEKRTELDNLPTQVERLGSGVVELIESKLQLLKEEVRDDARTYMRDGMILGAGGLLATIGFTLLSSRLPKGTGLVYMLVGGTTVMLMKDRLSQRSLLPQRSVEELKKDKEWVESKA